MGSSRRLATLLALLAAACQQGATVTIAQRHGTVQVMADRGDMPACVDDLDVVEVGAVVGTAAPVVWHIATADADLCVSRFTLGEVPIGFAEDAPLAALTPGRSYRVAVSGTGFMGAQRFTHVGSGKAAVR